MHAYTYIQTIAVCVLEPMGMFCLFTLSDQHNFAVSYIAACWLSMNWVVEYEFDNVVLCCHLDENVLENLV